MAPWEMVPSACCCKTLFLFVFPAMTPESEGAGREATDVVFDGSSGSGNSTLLFCILSKPPTLTVLAFNPSGFKSILGATKVMFPPLARVYEPDTRWTKLPLVCMMTLP